MSAVRLVRGALLGALPSAHPALLLRVLTFQQCGGGDQ